MEVLRGARRLANLNVVEGGELEEPLNARAGMLGALALVPMREQHHQSGEQIPLGFTDDDELVDDGLRYVGEVAELGFPQDQRLGKVAAVAVFESEHSCFGQS